MACILREIKHNARNRVMQPRFRILYFGVVKSVLFLCELQEWIHQNEICLLVITLFECFFRSNLYQSCNLKGKATKFLFITGVMLQYFVSQFASIDVGVYLCGCDIDVSEHLSNCL